MDIPPSISAVVEQLNQALNQTETQAREGLNLTREIVSRFPNNTILIQFFAYLSDVLLFVDIFRRRVQATEQRLSSPDVSWEDVQEVGEDLGELLGRVLEAKTEVEQILRRLEALS